VFGAHDNPPSLRQGDIIGNVLFPLSRPAVLKYLGTYSSGAGTDIDLKAYVDRPAGAKKDYVQCITHGVVGPGSVMSQCCDLDRKHPKPSFSVCRIVPFMSGQFKNVEALVNNIDPWGRENPHFQFFYIGKVNGLEGEYLADFGLVTSFSWADYELILGKKVHQLDDINRNRFRVKVGAFWGRPTQEDVDAGLANPYKAVGPVSKSVFDNIKKFLRG
jgi:hypothetical protein